MIYRGKINQPSSLQWFYNLHGTYCIVEDLGEASITVYFTHGPVHSMIIPREHVERIHISELS